MLIFEKLKPLALLLLRMAVGTIFLTQGYTKLFGSLAKWLHWFPQHGFPSYFAYVAGGMEFCGNGHRGLESEPAARRHLQCRRVWVSFDAGSRVVHTCGGWSGISIRGRFHL
jgi:hypothetical protein